MIFFINPYKNPYFNLAAEEFLLTKFTQGFAMLWQNENTVVVGKHQNALAEIDFNYVFNNNIKVARRISGGGAVFHDNGNLNFTIALPVNSKTNIIDFRRFIDPVIAYLKTIGVNAEPSGRNDIIVGNYKISGNAEHHFRKEKLILHHGTLLFDSNLDKLGNAIRAVPNRYADKAVQSVRSPVINIKELLKKDMKLDDFINGLTNFIVKHFDINNIRAFTCEETDIIEALAVTKFEKDSWNYGYSPAYNLNSDFEYNNEKGTIFLEVARESLIKQAVINHSNRKLFGELEKYLVGQKHFPKRIDSIIKHLIPSNQNDLSPLTFDFF